jgi:hypothetical protein
MAELQREIEHHVAEEEGELMPQMRESLDQEALNELGRRLMWPSRPPRPGRIRRHQTQHQD